MGDQREASTKRGLQGGWQKSDRREHPCQWLSGVENGNRRTLWWTEKCPKCYLVLGPGIWCLEKLWLAWNSSIHLKRDRDKKRLIIRKWFMWLWTQRRARILSKLETQSQRTGSVVTEYAAESKAGPSYNLQPKDRRPVARLNQPSRQSSL